jgi:tripartite-type tricarboxylate transporter receptor subunit TctC
MRAGSAIPLMRIALVVLAALLASDVARAQETYPDRPVRVVVPYPAGGGTDTLARLLADPLNRQWGQPVIVENVGGAAGNIGAAEVARAKPDGYTLLLASPGPIATNGFLYKEMGYDPARWVPIALLATGPYVLVLRKGFKASTVADLIARAKAEPGKITSATPGIGSVGHLSTVQLEMLADIKTMQIPYRGLSQAINDVIAEHVDMMFDTPTTSLALHRDGKIKIVAVGTTERVRELPDIPTIAESGLPGYRAVTWYAMVAPPHTPAALADRINRDIVDILARPEAAEKVRGIQMEPITKSRTQAAQFFVEEAHLWGKVIKQANIPLQ